MGTNNFVLFTVLASALSDETPYKLVFNAYANVLATVTPILRPVYEPGPSLPRYQLFLFYLFYFL